MTCSEGCDRVRGLTNALCLAPHAYFSPLLFPGLPLCLLAGVPLLMALAKGTDYKTRFLEKSKQ